MTALEGIYYCTNS